MLDILGWDLQHRRPCEVRYCNLYQPTPGTENDASSQTLVNSSRLGQ